MPRYTYRCPDCGEFDVTRPMTDATPVTSCARCGTAARRVFGAPAVRGLSPALRHARDLEEARRHEPVVTRRPAAPAPGPLPPVHAAPGRPPLPRT